LKTVTVGQGPQGEAYSPKTGEVYVANYLSNTVSVIKGTSVVATIKVSKYPINIAYDPTNQMMYVLSYLNTGKLSVINSQNKLVSTITLPKLPGSVSVYVDLKFDPANNYLYIVSSGQSGAGIPTFPGRVWIFSTACNCVKESLSLKSFGGFGIAFNPTNNYMYMTVGSGIYGQLGNVSIISSTSSPSIVKELMLPSGSPQGVAYSPLTKEMYVVNTEPGSVSEINGLKIANNKVFPPGPALCPFEITFDPKDGYMWIDDNCLWVIYLLGPTNTFGSTITTGNLDNPVGMVYNPSNTYMYVANGESFTVSIFTS
jgi:YVTN family beta-propeller protein